ncbi:MAG: NADH-quinone oxidoreductase subunit M [Rubrobacteraceae bacterium]
MLLTVTIFLPLLGALVLLFVPGARVRLVKGLALLVSGATLALTVALWVGYSGPGFDYYQKVEWIPSFGVGYEVGVDGISLPLIAMSALLFFASIIYSLRMENRLRAFFGLMLFLETASIGLFAALDLFLFYVFFDISLFGMYFIIAMWGGERKEAAAIKFFLYTLLGSLPMLLGFIVLYLFSDPLTFSIPELARTQPLLGNNLWGGLAFLGIFISFAIKTPLFPFHTWLPAAHVEAPTAGSIILAGVLLKMGTYGFVRISLTLLPDQFMRYALPIAILGLISVMYGAFVAMAQKDLKSLVAYTSINHMGYVILGVAVAAATTDALVPRTVALNGAVLQMIAHGLVTGALFLLVGVIYDYRAHTRDIDAFGGLAGQMPRFTALMVMAMFASLGLPGLAQFPAEFQVFLGTLQVYPVLAIIAVFGVLITAALFLRALQRIFLGEENPRWSSLKDADPRELISSALMLVFVVVIGVYPTWVLSLVNGSTTALLQEVARVLGG